MYNTVDISNGGFDAQLKEWLIELQRCFREPEDDFGAGIPTEGFLKLLETDLRLLRCPCLPSDVIDTTREISFVTGKYFLQVNKVFDVGHSAYSQMKQIKRRNDDISSKKSADSRHGTSDAIDHDHQTDTGHSRMLYVELTDGVNDVKGFEWKPIPCLDVLTKPGSKILLEGQVECRKGLLFLSGQNTTFLDGQVNRLLGVNGRVNLLAARLRNAILHSPPVESDDNEEFGLIQASHDDPVRRVTTATRSSWNARTGRQRRPRSSRLPLSVVHGNRDTGTSFSSTSSPVRRGRRSARSARSSARPRNRSRARSSSRPENSSWEAAPSVTGARSNAARGKRSGRSSRFARSTRAAYSARFATDDRSTTMSTSTFTSSTFPARFDVTDQSTHSATSVSTTTTKPGSYTFISDEEEEEFLANMDLDF